MGRTVPQETMLRLRSLLISRFHLQTHSETRDHGVYDLTQAKGGPRMRASDPAQRSNFPSRLSASSRPLGETAGRPKARRLFSRRFMGLA
jgi:uncharacterized protein (TIGR03435 family)